VKTDQIAYILSCNVSYYHVTDRITLLPEYFSTFLPMAWK